MDLVEYIISLPPLKATNLYENEFVSLAVFRSLEPLAKQYVARLIFINSSVPASIVTSWAKTTASSKHLATIETLSRLQLVTSISKADDIFYNLNTDFCQNIQRSLYTGISSKDFIPESFEKYNVHKVVADAFASKQWEALLLYAVGGGPAPEPAPLAVAQTPLNIRELLLASGVIVMESGSGGEHKITQKGFQFLLSDTYSQLWKLLKEYITRVEQGAQASLPSVLGFLLQLGVYNEIVLDANRLSPVEQNIAAHMTQLGLLYASTSATSSIVFRPTWLASLAASGNDSAVAKDDGYVVVETNFRVYAYTSSPVRQAILRLFIRCDVLLPNLFVGTITRESATAALESGVSAEQMIGYLRQHAHAQIQGRVPIVPGVVADQLRLWHKELHRLSCRNSVIYKNFEHISLYKEVVALVENYGSLLSKDDQKQEIIADAELHDRVRDKIKSVKQSLGIA